MADSKAGDLHYLYKYRSLAAPSLSFVERIFAHSEIYFPRPSEFNDPFDCSPTASLEATDEQFSKYLDGLYRRRMPHLSRAQRRHSVNAVMNDRARDHRSALAFQTLSGSLSQVVEQAGVLSLSAKCDHILMWSHYADSHRGICLRFRASSTTPFFGKAQRVSYQTARPKLNLILDSPQVQSEKALLTKADFWAYEDEWRIIEHNRGPGVHRFPPDLLDGVILGARISDADKQRILDLTSGRHGVDVLHAVFSSSEFRLEVLPLNG